MKKTLLRAIVCLVYIAVSGVVHAQDIHLSHLHASPLVLNPAMTGLYTGDLRFIANTRSQWNGITNGYRTVVGTVDSKLIKIGRNDVIGGGLQLYSDVAGDLQFRTRSTAVFLSVLKSLDNQGKHFLSIGMRNAVYSQGLDYTKIVAADEEPGVIEGFNNQRSYWDFGAGLAWFYGFDRFNSIHFGISGQHINKPDVIFFGNDQIESGTTLYRKIVIHGGAELKLSRKSFLKPSFLFADQGPHRQLTLGTFWKYKNFKHTSSTPGAAIYLGAWLRWHFESDFVSTDALIASIRLDYKQLYITFSFDVNISTLREVSYGRGGPELSVVKILDFKRKKRKSTKVKCPDF
ncbi:MAG: PorP/SprF family type IX secretion system membrane protein [Bacteroidota bacterium]